MVGKVCMAQNTDACPGIITRNVAVLEYENFIHRTFHRCIIHPHSPFRIVWEKSFLGIIPLRITLVSVSWVILSHEHALYRSIVLLFQVLNFLDVLLNFFTGYVDSHTEVTVLDGRKIARNYLLSFFVLDFVPCVPFELLFYLFHRNCQTPVDCCEILFHLTVFTLLLRLATFCRYSQNLGKRLLWNQFLLGMVRVCVIMYSSILVVNDFYSLDCENQMFYHSAQWKLRWNDTEEQRLEVYLYGLLTLLRDALYFDKSTLPDNPLTRCFVFYLSYFCGMILACFLLKYVMIVMKTREKILDLESRVHVFVRKRRLPSALALKTRLYCQVLLESKYYGEDEIFNYIPDTFKADIFFHLCLPLLKNFYPFEDLPTYLLRRLAESLRYQLFLPNEVVMGKDEPSLSMYFVHRGTVALYSYKHVELYHFEDGSSFNGRNLIMGEDLTSNYAISIEVTEIYLLDHQDFLDIMSTYPNKLRVIQDKVNQFRTGSSYILE